MDIDCLFNSLLFSELDNILNSLLINSSIKQLNTEYLWKSLLERDYKNDNIEISNCPYICKYKLHNGIMKINIQLNLKMKLNDLHLLKILNLYNNQLLLIPSELGNLTNLQTLHLNN